MAKLPQITYQSGPRLSLGPGPQQAVFEASQRSNIVSTAFRAASNTANAVAKRKGEDSALEANSRYQQDVSDFQKFAAQNPAATAEELSNWATEKGYDPDTFAGVDTSKFDARGEEQLPAHVWYATGLEEVMKASREKHQDIIEIPEYRRQWTRASAENAQQVSAQARVRAGEMETKYEYGRTKAEIELAVEDGSIQRARDLLSSSVFEANPIERQVLTRKVNYAEKEFEVSGRMAAATSLDDYESIVEDIMDPEWAGDITAGEQLKLINSTVTRRNAVQKAMKDAKKAQQDALSLEAIIAVSEGRAGMEEINSVARAVGLSNYLSLEARYRSMEAARRSGDDLTNPSVINSLERDITALKFGAQEGDFEDEIIALQSRILDGIGASFDAAQAKSLRASLNEATDEPFSNPDFVQARRSVSNMILGGEGPAIAAFASNDQRERLAQAEESLYQYIKANGGNAADLEPWKKNQLPRYLEEAAKAQLLNVSDDFQDYVVYSSGGEFRVDMPSTIGKIQEEISALEGLADLDNRDKQRLTNLYESATAFDKWRTQYGETYGTN